MLGDTSFLSLFSLKDQEKFLMFLQSHHLLSRRGGEGIGHQYHRVRSSGRDRRSSTLEEIIDPDREGTDSIQMPLPII